MRAEGVFKNGNYLASMLLFEIITMVNKGVGQRNQDTNKKPSVFEFSDYRVFLSVLIAWEKKGKFFSYAIFSDRAGFKSRSFLRLVISGKRNLTAEAMLKFIIGFGLSRPEAEGFSALVNSNQSSNLEAKQYYWEVFLKLRPKSHLPRRVQDEYKFLSRFYFPVLLILLRQPHARHDLDSLSQFTGLSKNQVEEGIQTLIDLGVVRREEADHFLVSPLSLETSDDIPSFAIQSFHRSMLKTAQEQLEKPITEREFQSVIVPLSDEEFNFIKKRLRVLAEEFDRQFSGVRPQSRKVYAINMNLVPMTPDFIRSDIRTCQKEVDVGSWNKEHKK